MLIIFKVVSVLFLVKALNNLQIISKKLQSTLQVALSRSFRTHTRFCQVTLSVCSPLLVKWLWVGGGEGRGREGREDRREEREAVTEALGCPFSSEHLVNTRKIVWLPALSMAIHTLYLIYMCSVNDGFA